MRYIIPFLFLLVIIISCAFSPEKDQNLADSDDLAQIVSLTDAIESDGELTEDYICLSSNMFSNVIFSVRLEVYERNYYNLEINNLPEFGIFLIPETSSLSLSCSYDEDIASILLFDSGKLYEWQATFSRDVIERWLRYYQIEYAKIESTISIDFDEWLRVKLIENTYNLYAVYLAEAYSNEILPKDLNVEAAVLDMQSIWGIVIEPGLTDILIVRYEIKDHGHYLKYEILYKDLTIIAGGPLESAPALEDGIERIEGEINF